MITTQSLIYLPNTLSQSHLETAGILGASINDDGEPVEDESAAVNLETAGTFIVEESASINDDVDSKRDESAAVNLETAGT